MTLLTMTRPTPPAQPPLRFLAAEENERYGLPYSLLNAHRPGDIDPEVNRVLHLLRTFAAFADDEHERSQVLLSFSPADEEGMDLPLLHGDEFVIGKRIAINYGAHLSAEIDSDQFEFARWLTEYKLFAAQHNLLGRLELTVFYGEDTEFNMETALTRVEWLVAEGHLVLTQPYALALGY